MDCSKNSAQTAPQGLQNKKYVVVTDLTPYGPSYLMSPSIVRIFHKNDSNWLFFNSLEECWLEWAKTEQ